MPIARGGRRIWPWVSLGAASLWGAGQVMRRQMYAPHYPDVAMHAGLALVARPRRVLALAAHPGDLELHAGGTLFLMARAGSTITAATLTRGAAGAGGRQNLTEVRAREQEQAAAILGYDRLVQLDLPDRGLTEHPRLAPALRRVWEEVNPEVVLAPDPTGIPGLGNPDTAATGYAALHTALGGTVAGAGPGPTAPELPTADGPGAAAPPAGAGAEAAEAGAAGAGAEAAEAGAAGAEAVEAGGADTAAAEAGTAKAGAAELGRAALVVAREHIPAEVRLLLYGSRRPNLLVDITESLQEKVHAVKCHRSQLPGPDRVVDSAVRRLGRMFRSDTAAYYVEGFYRVL